MPAPPFRILTAPEFDKQLCFIVQADVRKHKKVLQTVGLLRDVGPRHPGLHAHKY